MPSSSALLTAIRLSEYLVTGMHHYTSEGRLAMAQIIQDGMGLEPGDITPLIEALFKEIEELHRDAIVLEEEVTSLRSSLYCKGIAVPEALAAET